MITISSLVKHKKIYEVWSENKEIIFPYQYVLPYGTYEDSKNKVKK